MIDDATPLRSKLKKKGSRYGQLDQPYLVALLCAGDLVEDHDIADALLGTTAVRYYPGTQRTEIVRQLEGFWHARKGPQNTRVSAVMTVPRLNWSSIIITEPTIWLNPWSAHPLKAPLPWRTHTITTDGHFTTTEATRSAANVLALPASWPA